MKRKIIGGCLLFVCLALIGLNCGKSDTESSNQPVLSQKQQLGKLLFFDKNLSTPRGQSCADCHAPETGFSNPVGTLPVSRGVHLDRFGNRNDLTASYVADIPDFHYDADEDMYVGGTFWDGRAIDIVEQAKGPFLNVLEMANPDEQAVVDEVKSAEYAALFKTVYGENSLENTLEAYNMIADAIAEYERSPELNKFNSKYDLYLRGELALTEQEMRGLDIFDDKGECAECHPSGMRDNGAHPLFTDYTYDNLGVPKNAGNPFYYLPGDLNPDGVRYVDLGLGGVVEKPEENGKFRVPTLRNAAITAPYLHNGLFSTLRDVVVFYNTRDTGPWPPPEVSENVNHDELGNLGLSAQEIDDLVAFIETLTDDYVPGD
ncbi:cytochrome-c peroxidase [Candidatus Latescibacterota bacterium]